MFPECRCAVIRGQVVSGIESLRTSAVLDSFKSADGGATAVIIGRCWMEKADA